MYGLHALSDIPRVRKNNSYSPSFLELHGCADAPIVAQETDSELFSAPVFIFLSFPSSLVRNLCYNKIYPHDSITIFRFLSSAGEHYLDMVGVAGSIPVGTIKIYKNEAQSKIHFDLCLVFLHAFPDRMPPELGYFVRCECYPMHPCHQYPAFLYNSIPLTNLWMPSSRRALGQA